MTPPKFFAIEELAVEGLTDLFSTDYLNPVAVEALSGLANAGSCGAFFRTDFYGVESIDLFRPEEVLFVDSLLIFNL